MKWHKFIAGLLPYKVWRPWWYDIRVNAMDAENLVPFYLPVRNVPSRNIDRDMMALSAQLRSLKGL